MNTVIHYILSIFIRCKRASKTDRWNSFRNRYVRICAAAFMEYRFNIQRLQTKPRGFYQWCMGILSSARNLTDQVFINLMVACDAIACTPAAVPPWKLETQKLVFGSDGTVKSAIFATALAAAWIGCAISPNAPNA